MQLIGYLDSPFVRRVAISMRFLGVEYEHRELSIFRNYDEFRGIHPAVKVPTLVCDDGTALIDSTLIINYLEQQLAHRSLMPTAKAEFQEATYVIGLALVAMEKVAQLIYETGHRPQERQHGPWIERIEQQLSGAIALMESSVAAAAQAGKTWLLGDEICQADISTAVAWRFTQHIDRVRFGPEDYPALAAYSEKAEGLPEFKACPLSG
jgi:glutathione S-transferase